MVTGFISPVMGSRIPRTSIKEKSLLDVLARTALFLNTINPPSMVDMMDPRSLSGVAAKLVNSITARGAKPPAWASLAASFKNSVTGSYCMACMGFFFISSSFFLCGDIVGDLRLIPL